MTRQSPGRQIWLLVLPIVVALAVAPPAAAQTGQIRGTVKDAQGQPVEGANVTIEEENTSRQWKTKSDRRGEFTQIGLRSGRYKVTAEKEGVGAISGMTQVSLSQPATPELRLVPAGVDPSIAGDPEALAKGAALQAAFEAGVAANNAKNYDEAITKFNEALAISDKCSECYYNVGVIYSEQKKYDQAENAFKKAIEAKPDYADAYNGLANVYNATRRFDEAGQASAKAAELSGAGLIGGGSADTLARQAMILFNSGKAAEAKPIAQQALSMDANNADAHFIMGMILLTENPAQAKTELESFLKLTTDQNSQNAATAKSLIPELEKMIPK
jgi:tetratricopeptide (TPR) repeat protein